MAKKEIKKMGTHVRGLIERMLDGMPPEIAFALGCATHHLDEGDAAARLLVAEGIGEIKQWSHDTKSKGYYSDDTLGLTLRDALVRTIEAQYPEQPAEPEPVPDEPTQPVPAPTFTPDPEPANPPAATATVEVRSACLGCGRPDVGGTCRDCATARHESAMAGLDFDRAAPIPEDVVESMRRQRG